MIPVFFISQKDRVVNNELVRTIRAYVVRRFLCPELTIYSRLLNSWFSYPLSPEFRPCNIWFLFPPDWILFWLWMWHRSASSRQSLVGTVGSGCTREWSDGICKLLAPQRHIYGWVLEERKNEKKKMYKIPTLIDCPLF